MASERGEKDKDPSDTVQLRNRVGPDEGVRKAEPTEPGPGEMSIFDGKGNEIVVVNTVDKDGNFVQGTGATSEAAMKDAKKGKEKVGKGMWTDPHAH
jgi:hypothetical protein